jgi:hypothetical protein
VNKITDFDMSTKGSTKVELLQIYDLTAYTNGNIKQPYLYTLNDRLFVTTQKNSEYIYSTSGWKVVKKPYWLNISIEGNYLHYSVDTIIFSDRKGFIQFTNTEGLTYFLEVVQEGENSYLYTNPNTVTFSGDGGSIKIGVNTYPNTVSILNKPDWCNASIQRGFLNDNAISLSCNTNNSVLGRKGNLILTNGVDTVKVIINQQGIRTITVTDTNGSVLDLDKPIILSEIDDTNITVTIDKEINVNTLRATNIEPTKPNKKIGKLNITLPISQTKSGQRSLGGCIRVNQTDNTTVIIDYNIGENLKKYLVYIDGNVIVDNNNYYPYYELVEENTKLVVTAIETQGKIFLNWSDGITDITRTITVNSDIHIYPIYTEEEEGYLYDNELSVLFDNKKIIDYI